MDNHDLQIGHFTIFARGRGGNSDMARANRRALVMTQAFPKICSVRSVL